MATIFRAWGVCPTAAGRKWRGYCGTACRSPKPTATTATRCGCKWLSYATKPVTSTTLQTCRTFAEGITRTGSEKYRCVTPQLSAISSSEIWTPCANTRRNFLRPHRSREARRMKPCRVNYCAMFFCAKAIQIQRGQRSLRRWISSRRHICLWPNGESCKLRQLYSQIQVPNVRRSTNFTAELPVLISYRGSTRRSPACDASESGRLGDRLRATLVSPLRGWAGPVLAIADSSIRSFWDWTQFLQSYDW